MRMSELWADMAHLSSLPSEEDIKRAGESLLRDQFAMVALPALIADPDSVAYPIGHAKQAYRYADAMLKARKMELE